MHLFSALLCIAVHPKRFTITGQRRQCAHHTPATGGEERESQSSGLGLLGGCDWQGPVVGIWPGHRGYTPTLVFLMTTESQDLGLTSHPKDGACWQYSVPVTQTTGWAPPAGLTTTSSSSNLVFLGGLPSRYWPGPVLLSFSGQPVLGCRVIWLPVHDGVELYELLVGYCDAFISCLDSHSDVTYAFTA